MRVNEQNYQILHKAEELLGIEYGIEIDDEYIGIIERDSIVEMIDDLCSEIDRLKEEIDDQKEYYENYIKDYYKPLSPYEIYGVNENEYH